MKLVFHLLNCESTWTLQEMDRCDTLEKLISFGVSVSHDLFTGLIR
jgi:hypothetical protein